MSIKSTLIVYWKETVEANILQIKTTHKYTVLKTPKHGQNHTLPAQNVQSHNLT